MPGQSLDFISQVADLNEKSALEIAKRRLADGEEPLVLVNECRQGMRIVGERYGEGRYFIAGLIMAGEILRQVTDTEFTVTGELDRSMAEAHGPWTVNTLTGFTYIGEKIKYLHSVFSPCFNSSGSINNTFIRKKLLLTDQGKAAQVSPVSRRRRSRSSRFLSALAFS